MNIDDFLDKASGDKDVNSDTIDISNEDVDSMIPSTRSSNTIFSNEEVPRPNSPEEPREYLSSSKESEVPSPSTPVTKTVESKALSKSVSTPVTKKNVPENSVLSDFENTSQEILSALKSKNLQAAMSAYKKLRSQYDAIPLKNISAKRELHSVLLQVNEKISHLSDEYHHKTETLLHDIEELIHEGEHFLHDGNVKSATIVAKKIKEVYSAIPVKNDPAVRNMKSHIYQYWANVQEKSHKIALGKFHQISTSVKKLLNQSQEFLSQKNITQASSSLKQAEKLFETLNDSDMSQKMELYHMLTKQQYAIDVISQIKSLQSELSDLPVYSKQKSFVAKPKKSSFPEPSVDDKSELSVKNDASLTRHPVKDELVKSARKDAPSNDSYAKNVDRYESSKVEMSRGNFAVDAAVKKIKCKKIKLDILHGELDKAKMLLSSLESQFGNTPEIASLKVLLAKRMKEGGLSKQNLEDDIVDSEVKTVEEDLKKGDFYGAEHELESFKSKQHDSLYKSFATELEHDVEEAEESFYMSELKKKLLGTNSSTKSLSHSHFDDITLRQIARKIVLAKHQLKKGDKEKAKNTLNEIFKIDPDNNDAKEILQMVRQ